MTLAPGQNGRAVTAAALPRRRPPADPRLLQRSLLLAALLHVWLVLVFGNATGTAAPGQGVWGSLTVELLGRGGSGTGDAAAREWRDNGPPGDGRQPRAGGQVRPAEPAPDDDAGAAELGRWTPREVAPEAARGEALSPAAPAPPATLSLPEGFRPIEREDLSPPRPAPLPPPAPALPAAVGRLEAAAETAVAPLAPAASLRTNGPAAELPTAPELPPPVRRLEAPPATAALPRATDLRVTPAPAAPATPPAPAADLPAAVQRLEAPADGAPPTRVLPRPTDLRTPLPAAATAMPAETALPPAVQRLEGPPPDAAAVTPLTRPGELRSPAASPSATTAALPGASDLPPPVQRLESPDAGSAVQRLQPVPGTRPASPAATADTLPALSGALPGQVSASPGPARGDPNAPPGLNPDAAAGTSAGSPAAGSRLGRDLALPPSAAASAPRAPLNLSLPRGGEMAARGSPGLVELLPQPPERKSKLEQSIEDATNKDCRKAYANAGLLAVVPLAVDAARGKGCKW